jgi:asparagine synthetase B (glutamine-hydrolysing)
MQIRKTLNKIIDKHDTDTYYLLLSAGLDSQSLLFSALELGKNVIVVSFTRDDRESRDFKKAKAIAETLGLEFIPVYLPTSLSDIKKYTLMLSNTYECKGKTEFECTYPMLFAYKAIKEHSTSVPVILSGLAADCFYVLSKNGIIHFKDEPDAFREKVFFKENYCQKRQHEILKKEFDIQHVMPYLSMEMFNLFKGVSWNECNTPKQKNHVRDQYKDELIENHYFPHRSYQSGDNGISDLFKQLVDSDWNIKNWKSAVGIFNAVTKGEIK